MEIANPLPDRVLVGLGLLALAGVVFPWTQRLPVLAILLALPGGSLIGTSGLPGPAWVVPLVVGVIATVGPVSAWFDHDAQGSPVPAVLLAISVVGVWLTVPDTEEALVLLGAMALPTLLAWPMGVARLGAVGVHPLVGLYMWVVAWGGRGREGSIVGAAAALGLLLAAPIGTWLAHKQKVSTTAWPRFWLIGLQILVVAVTTRVAGLQTDPTAAAGIAAPALIASVLLWVAVERSFGHAPRLEPGG